MKIFQVLLIALACSLAFTGKEEELSDSKVTKDVEDEFLKSSDLGDGHSHLGHKEDVKAEHLRQELIREYFADEKKVYDFTYVRDVLYRFFLEESYEEIVAIRNKHVKGTHADGDETVLGNADWLENYLGAEWKNKESKGEYMTSEEASELLSHGRYEKYTDANSAKLMDHLDQYITDDAHGDEIMNSDVHGLLADGGDTNDDEDTNEYDMDSDIPEIEDFELEDF